MNMRDTVRKLKSFLIVLMLACVTHALAGAIVPQIDSVIFRTGKAGIQPRQEVIVEFSSSEYFFGADRWAYVPIAIAPARNLSEPITTSMLEREWNIYGALASTPQGLQLGDAARPYRLTFKAPETPGDYMIVIAREPLFRLGPIKSGAGFKESFVPHNIDRLELSDVIWRGRNNLRSIAEFSVSSESKAERNLSPPLYLKVNGTVPTGTQLNGGIAEDPVTFSWSIGSEFKKSTSSKVSYRYMIRPQNGDYGTWTTATEARYYFLQKGVHQFLVQARYTEAGKDHYSIPASFQFALPKDHIARPTLKGPFGSVVERENIVFEQVYAKSRALLIGAWKFEDSTNFPQFDKVKIEKDLSQLEASLQKNGFSVTTLKGESVNREEIVEALQELVDSANRDDRLFVYFSTHGFPDPGNPTEGYLATSDCKMRSPTVRCLRLNDLQTHVDRALDGKNVRQVLFAIDSCFSGLGIVRKASGTAADMTQLAAPQGAFMLTAGMANQTAEIDQNLGMSTFTHYLVEGLNGKADIMGNSGLITLSELYVYVQYNVASATGAKQIPMLGRMKGDGEMIFKPAR